MTAWWCRHSQAEVGLESYRVVSLKFPNNAAKLKCEVGQSPNTATRRHLGGVTSAVLRPSVVVSDTPEACQSSSG
eukprot:scaffold47674_cov25-Prasinocladus_malaysianus.AAC.1